ncbi:HD domain-containing protein [candidate division WOR-3 bacterium]|nr:HD domain-containing protein [candidate division WOR-3 bacterium]MCK4527440.1 HD domain-containing protein [candidate division WOR-3 bacterium]
MDINKSLIEIGIKLSSERNLDRLLYLILQSARYICNADAGSLYLKEEKHLCFAVSQNATLEIKMGSEEFRKLFSPHTIPISNKSIAGWSAANKKVLNLGDVYQIKNAPYSFDRKFDKETGYRCHSMLTVPMKDKEDNLIGVFQLINKRKADKIEPFTKDDEKVAEALASQASVAINNVQLTEEIKAAHLETIYKLGLAAEYKDEETGNHIRRMSEFSKIIAESLGLDEGFIETIYHASPLHDVGKIGIPDNILTKAGKLTPEEWKIMKGHTILGYQLLKDSHSKIMQIASEIAYTHHERWDGKGYPRGLSKEEIPLTGRVVSLADFFDAVTSSRPYRDKPFPLPKTLRIIKEEAGKHFCPKIVDAFFDSIDRIKEIHYILSEGVRS